MPRKASQAAKKEASSETKNEGGSTRRSGRATTKQEPTKETGKEATGKEGGKEATRSRRSSTAAQTAASVLDSKTPKRSGSSRDDASPSEGRQKTRRESVESPATRVKSARRASSRVNYKESDGEEENAAPKYDETFDSNEEFGDSDSDEKNKTKGKTRGAKSPGKTRGAKDKAKGGRGRRGRPKKPSSDEEDMEPIELSEESIEVEEEIIKKPETSTRGGRSRRGKAESETKSEEKSKSSRRSARASSAKESPKKRPSRSLQTKRYTEDDEEDDDIEEIDSKDEEDAKPQTESGRKRKRGSAAESNKRPKEEEVEDLTKDDDEDDVKEEADKKEPSESVTETEKESEKKESGEEKMEVDEEDAKDEADKSETAAPKDDKTGETTEPVKEEKKDKGKEDKKDKGKEEKKDKGKEEKKDKGKEESENVESKSSKEKLSFSKKQGSVDSSENLDESIHSYDSDQGSRAEQSISSSLEDSQDTKETKPSENKVSAQEKIASENTKSKVDYQEENSDSFQGDESSESKSLKETVMNNDQKAEPLVDKKEKNLDAKIDNHEESLPEGSNSLQAKKMDELDSKTPVASSVSHSKESTKETSFNGSENISNSSPVIHSTPAVSLHPGESAPKANGEHDVHSNSVSENDQYYLLPGRKYIKNSKLGESIRQSVKDKSFGFVSYNLGITSADSSIQKEKLLNELNKLDAHIICIQQVSKSFFCSILEPSLDALGFKGTFSQPEESEKGMATFYKSSLFRLSGQSEASLKHLIEKEIEASSLDASDRIAVKSYVKKCGHILLTNFATVIGMHSVTVANVQVPPSDLSVHALQVSCLVKEVVRVNGGTSRPFLLGGEFNMIEAEASYQLLRDGYLSNDMIEELQRRKDVSLPGKENAALVNLLWKSFQHPSSTLCSCYKSVLDHEVFIPEQKATSRDLLWYSSDSLYTVGVLDASDTLNDHHFSLKADVAFSV